jgi:ATP-dependent DNA ligase
MPRHPGRSRSRATHQRVKLTSRNGVDHTRRFRDWLRAISKLSARTLVLDSEVAIYDQQLRLRFDWLRDPEAVASPPSSRDHEQGATALSRRGV